MYVLPSVLLPPVLPTHLGEAGTIREVEGLRVHLVIACELVDVQRV